MDIIKNRKGKIGKLLNKFKIRAEVFINFQESLDKIDTVESDLIALDTETTSLTFWNDGNYILGYSLAINDKEGYYFNTRCWNKNQHKTFIKKLNSLNSKKTFWNWYFDYGYSKAHYGVGLESTYDGMIWFHSLFTNRSLEEIKGKKKRKGYSLKEITAEFTEYGDYESELKEVKHILTEQINKWISEGCYLSDLEVESFYNENGYFIQYKEELSNITSLINKYISNGKSIKEKEFCYGFFPDNILDIYAIFDVLATWNLTKRCIDYAAKMYKNGWEKIYDIINIKQKSTKLYADASVRGFKIDRGYVKKLSDEWKPLREMSFSSIYNMPEIKKVESMLFRDELIKEQNKKKPYNPLEFSKDKFKKYFRDELKKEQLKVKNIMPLKKCRKIYNNCLKKWNNKKQKSIIKSKVTLSKCRKIYNSIEFNLNSSNHKYKLFIDLLDLKPLEYNPKDKEGNKSPKLDNTFVEYYAERGYDFMEKINTYSLYQKGISSFLGTDENSEKGLWNLTTDEHPYVHSNFNITGTTTSRLSTSNPNISQSPSRGVLHKLKNCFVVEEDYKLFTFDFSTSELRILGALAKEENFLSSFRNGLDLHSKMAYSIWKDEMDLDHTLPEKELLSQVKDKYGDTYRYYAKGINFGLPYSITEVGLSKSIGVSKKEAKSYIEGYEKANPKIKEFMDWSKDKVMKKGYTEGSYGERLYLNNAKGYNWKKDTRRKNWNAINEYKKATNFIIQSDNAFMLYYSLVSFFDEIEKNKLDVTLIATIYDSIYIRVHKSIDDKLIYNMLKKHFEIDFYGIDMKIDVGIALNDDYTYSNRWGKLKEISYEDLKKIVNK